MTRTRGASTAGAKLGLMYNGVCVQEYEKMVSRQYRKLKKKLEVANLMDDHVLMQQLGMSYPVVRSICACARGKGQIF